MSVVRNVDPGPGIELPVTYSPVTVLLPVVVAVAVVLSIG